MTLNTQADIPRLVRALRQRTGLTQEKFAAKLGVTAELREQTARSAKLDQLIWANLEDIGYGR
jgi:transcriptional regulator with XRE-family HTH domain